MDIQVEKIEVMKLILETENPTVIESIKKLFKKSKIDFWDNLSQDKKDDILLGINDIEEGNVIKYEDFISQYR